MTFILALMFCILFSILIINNLVPNFSIKYRRFFTRFLFLFTLLNYSILISLIVSGNPDYSKNVTFNWLRSGSTSLNVIFVINNPIVIFGAMLATLFLIQIINLFHRQDSQNLPAFQDNNIWCQINCIFTLIIAGLIILLVNSLLVLYGGMVLISGIVLYRNLFINGGKTSIAGLIGFLIADSIYLIAILYACVLFNTSSISGITAIVTGPVQNSSFNIVGFLIILSIIVKLVYIPYSEHTINLNSSVNQRVFSISAVSIMMILLQRFMNILCNSCLLFIMIIGIIIALYSAFSSIFKNSALSSYKSLLFAQIGVFLIIIGSQLSINTLLFIVSFTFINLLLILSQKASQQVQLVTVSKNSPYKSGRVWIFLFAVFGINGLLPGSGFIPRNVLIQQYLISASDNPLFWTVLVFVCFCLFLISFASFRYFFNSLYRWKNQIPSDSSPQFQSDVLLGILVLLNLYPVFSLPHLNPLTIDSWIYQIIGNSEMFSNIPETQLYTAFGITIGIPLIGFFLALLSYYFQVIKSSSIRSVLKPIMQLYTISKTLSTNFRYSISRWFSWLPAAFISIEDTTIQKSSISLSVFINSVTVGFVSLNRKFSGRKSATTIINHISNALLVSWEKHDLLIPFLLVIIIVVIFVLSII
ncbi:MAG: hypothetical protein JXR87_04030 [Candidatus Marinimicrobia bacterium]|nr:hypothetical protein [Candidatus Neomarinimicrobiota bacterium]